MDEPGSKRPASNYFRSNPSIAPFEHQRYLEPYIMEVDSHDRWLAWEQKHLGISANLRLASPDKEIISPEFAYMLNKHTSYHWLTMLRDSYLGKTRPMNEQMILVKIGQMRVTCTDGSFDWKVLAKSVRCRFVDDGGRLGICLAGRRGPYPVAQTG